MIMNGGVGFGDTQELLKNIMLSKSEFQVVIVNSRNEKMLGKIDEYLAENNITNVKNIGFANNVDLGEQYAKVKIDEE